MNNYEEIERGRLAQGVLDNPAFLEAFAQVEKEITAQWKQSKSPDEREKLHLSLSLLSRVESVLKKAVSDGTVANRIVEREWSLKKLGLK